jgi:hypothetical protein
VPDDARQSRIESLHVVALADGLDDVQEVRVGPGKPLSKLDERPRERVGALDCDGDGDGRVGVGEEVGGPVADASSAQNVHAIIDHNAHSARHLLLHDS